MATPDNIDLLIKYITCDTHSTFTDMYTKHIASASRSMGLGRTAGNAMHRAMEKIPLFGSGKRIRGIRNPTKPTKPIIFDDYEMYNMSDFRLIESHTIVIDSLTLVQQDCMDMLFRNVMEDDCTWKQGQVAKWCNKYPKRCKK